MGVRRGGAVDALIPCEGGPNPGWIRVEDPLPLEVDRGGPGIYVLDDLGDTTRYVWLENGEA